MRIALGNDHAGFSLKRHVVDILAELGHEILDRGAPDETPVDFPDITMATCDLVRRGEADRAVLVCGTGIGAVIAANKIPGIRAGLGHDVFSAHQGVEHDDTNAIALGAWLIGPATAREVLAAFLGARFDNDEDTRRRVAKLRQMELTAVDELKVPTPLPESPDPHCQETSTAE
ncbi:RpiB/LacA/LacB family sugar-phosphate isomerase [Rhodococcus koreensis]|uniref:RpiB/LacA/LacB family sugar-phosphate isomerase n=1 Tax=Rhodococcus koreensis TaxID=99653 RepID=UPI003671474F